ncbi:MAG TPA: hypothetical protein VF495_24330 [Phenylobacterium sp.]
MRDALIGVVLAVGLTAAGPAPTGHEQMLRGLIADTMKGSVRYETFTPDLAVAVRPQADVARAEILALGALKSVTLQTTDKDGMEIYRTVFEKGALDWAFHVNGAGLIDNAAFRPVRPPPAS